MKRLASITLGLVLFGCGPAVDAGSGTDTDDPDGSSSTGGAGEVSTANPTTATTTPGTSTSTTTTSPPSTTTPTATDPTIGPDESSSGFFGSSSTGFIGSSGSSESGNPDGLPDGSKCNQDDQCASGSCFVSGLGGLCGECSGDEDCEFGCSLPNPLATPPEGSVCNEGNLGDGCESDAACPGLECVNVINVPGILEANTCSECEVDADCMPDQVCDVSLDIANLSGVWTCVATSSVSLGEFCAQDGSGDEACTSGHCATANLKGLIEFGVCSECEVTGDCMPGQTCFEPEVGLDGSVTAGFCG